MSRDDKRRIRNMMKDYHITNAFESELRTWGLKVTKTNKHVKIVRIDGKGGMVIISATRSDNRGGKKAATHIIRLLED